MRAGFFDLNVSGSLSGPTANLTITAHFDRAPFVGLNDQVLTQYWDITLTPTGHCATETWRYNHTCAPICGALPAPPELRPA